MIKSDFYISNPKISFILSIFHDCEHFAKYFHLATNFFSHCLSNLWSSRSKIYFFITMPFLGLSKINEPQIQWTSFLATNWESWMLVYKRHSPLRVFCWKSRDHMNSNWCVKELLWVLKWGGGWKLPIFIWTHISQSWIFIQFRTLNCTQ